MPDADLQDELADLEDCDLHVRIADLMQSREGSETGEAFFLAMRTALLDMPVLERLVVLGEVSEVLGKLQVIFLSDGVNAAFQAMGLE